MNRFLLAGLCLLSSFAFLGCTTGDRFTVGGVPGWLADGAQIDDEPEPYRPDPAIIVHEEESDPINFKWIADNRTYPTPPVKKVAKKTTSDPFERGRAARIRRLVR